MTLILHSFFKRLGPIGIKTPIEAKEIEILQEQTKEIELVTQNFQYVCANFANCMTIGCLNGGISLNKNLELNYL